VITEEEDDLAFMQDSNHHKNPMFLIAIDNPVNCSLSKSTNAMDECNEEKKPYFSFVQQQCLIAK